MGNLTQRLRQACRSLKAGAIEVPELLEAADEIERLRAALRSIQDEYWPVMDDVKYQSRDLCVAIEKSWEALNA